MEIMFQAKHRIATGACNNAIKKFGMVPQDRTTDADEEQINPQIDAAVFPLK